jgi:hypothetical protein
MSTRCIKTEEEARSLFRELFSDQPLHCCICSEVVIYPMTLDTTNCDCKKPVYCAPCFAMWRDSDYRVISQFDHTMLSYRFVLSYSNIHHNNQIRCACCRKPMRTYQRHHGNCSVEDFFNHPSSLIYLDLLLAQKFPDTTFQFECLWCTKQSRTIQEIMTHMFGRPSCCENTVPCQFCGTMLKLYAFPDKDYDQVFWDHVETECSAPRCPFPMCSTFAEHQPLTRDTFQWHMRIHNIQHQISAIPNASQFSLFDISTSSSRHPGWSLDDMILFQQRLQELRAWTQGCDFVRHLDTTGPHFPFLRHHLMQRYRSRTERAPQNSPVPEE